MTLTPTLIGRQVTTCDADDIVNVGTITAVDSVDSDFVLVQWPDSLGETWIWMDELAPVRRSTKAGA